MKVYVWLVRREFWENRAIWVVPVAIGVALTLASLFGKVQGVPIPSPEQSHAVGGMILFGFGVTFFVVMNIYCAWYLLDCLYSDRRDRSILFWKSMPLTDSAMVLAKLFTGVIAIPLTYFIASDVSTLLIAFVVSVRAHDALGFALWQPTLWFQLQVFWLYLIVTMAIWYLPVTGWLLVVSAWAKRAVMLWSVLPLVAAYLLERWFLGTHFVGTALNDRMFGYLTAFKHSSDPSGWVSTVIDRSTVTTPGSVWQIIDPAGFLLEPQTWIGVVAGAALVALAIQLRLRRTEA